MVDFNNEATIGTPAVDVVRILILQRHSDLIEAWEDYLKKKYSGVQPNKAIVSARLLSLFLQIQPAIKRRYTPKEYEKIEKELRGVGTEEDIQKQIYFLNEYLDDIKLTRIDTKKPYDKTKVEIENKAKGL